MASTGFSFFLALLVIAGTEGRNVADIFKRQDQCSETEMNACLQNLALMRSPISSSKLAVLDEASMDAMCQTLTEARRCISDYLRTCSMDHTDIMVETIEGVVEYICSSEGRDALLTEQQCWANEALEARLNECVEEMQNEAMAMAINQAPPSAFCGLFAGVRRCARQKVQTLCNSVKAANFVDRLLYYSLRPSGQQIGCNISLRVTRDLFKMFQMTRK